MAVCNKCTPGEVACTWSSFSAVCPSAFGHLRRRAGGAAAEAAAAAMVA
jgi:hypothetical protein